MKSVCNEEKAPQMTMKLYVPVVIKEPISSNIFPEYHHNACPDLVFVNAFKPSKT